MEDFKDKGLVSVFRRLTGYLYLLAILTIISLVIVVMYKSTWNNMLIDGKYREFNTSWQVISDTTDYGSINLPAALKDSNATFYRISNTLPDNLTDMMVMCIRATQQMVDVYVDDEIVYSYPTSDYLSFGKSYGNSWCFVELTPEWSGKEITIEFRSSFNKYRGLMNKIYIGSRNGIVNKLMYKYGMPMLVGIVVVILSTVFVLYYFMLRLYGKSWKQLLYLGLSTLSVAMWIICENKLSQFVFGNVAVSNMLIFMCLMLIPVPFLLCSNEIQKGRYSKIILPFTLIVVADFFVQIVLYIKNVFDLMEMVFVSHIFICITIVLIIVTMYETYIKQRSHDVKSYGLCFIVLVVFSLGEIANFYLSDNPEQMGLLLSIGCLFFISMQGYFSVCRVMELITEREKAIAASEAKTSVLRQVNHEIRTPLNAIFGMNQMILAEDVNDNVKTYASNIKAASDTLESLVNEILDFTRMDEDRTTLVNMPYNFTTMLNEVIWMVKYRIGDKDIQFAYNVPDNIPENYIGDELRIKQILLNILVNAVKYTDKGYVKLALECKVEGERVEFTYKISDSGRGIPKEAQKHIFEKYVRVDGENNPKIEGTGLGLTITKELLNRIGGTIEVWSVYGQGSTFTIKYSQQIADVKAINSNLSEDVRLKGKSILVVDDSTTNLAVIAGVLKNTGINVECVLSGEKCLDTIMTTGFDVILMDYHMPGMSGKETLERIRRMEKEGKVCHKNGIDAIPVVVLTANGTAIDREECKKEGFDEFISKPVKKDVLMEVLIRFFDKPIE